MQIITSIYLLLILPFGLISSFTIFSSQSTNLMTTFTIKKGKHFSFPRKIRPFRKRAKRVQWKVIFNNDCKYIIKNPDGTTSVDQKDWNKLCGVFYNLYKTRKDAAMVGWRFNPTKNRIEIAPYYHVGGGRDLFKISFMDVNPDDILILELDINYEAKIYYWTFTNGTKKVSHQMKFFHNRRRGGFIQFYFGGNQKAPSKVSAQIEEKLVQ